MSLFGKRAERRIATLTGTASRLRGQRDTARIDLTNARRERERVTRRQDTLLRLIAEFIVAGRDPQLEGCTVRSFADSLAEALEGAGFDLTLEFIQLDAEAARADEAGDPSC
jgi:hypothetical protein